MNWTDVPVQVGQVIAGKFKVEQVLGVGGVGLVVAARHLQLDERVALKFLLPEALRSEIDVARFCREAQAAVRLKNEHVARVIDIGTLEGGSPYMVMEYLTGTDLADLLEARGPLPQEQAVDFVLQACEAIAEAHNAGFVHRDIKPSNLFLTERADGSSLIKVLDFGIAKATAPALLGEGAQDLTRTKTMLGSPMYMSPEQVRNSKDVDHRSDVWSLGVVLYELLTGAVPFDADSVTGIVAAVIGDPFTPIRERRPEIPVELAEVVARCLQKNPDHRFRDVAEFAFALAPFAPEHALVSVDRIAGTLQTKVRRERTPRASTGGNSPPHELVAATTVRSAAGASLAPSNRRGAFLAGLVAALLVVAIGVGTLFTGRESAAGGSAAPLAASSAAPSVGVQPEVIVAPATTAAVPVASSEDAAAPPPASVRRAAAARTGGRVEALALAPATSASASRPRAASHSFVPADRGGSRKPKSAIDETVDTRR